MINLLRSIRRKLLKVIPLKGGKEEGRNPWLS